MGEATWTRPAEQQQDKGHAMLEQTKDEVDDYYYYDSHPTEEDLMGESIPHAELIDYLKYVLLWLFRGQACGIYTDFSFYYTSERGEYPLAPDVAVVLGGPQSTHPPMRSWKIGEHGPAAHVVFEIASKTTWERDLEEKPAEYDQMGVQEYYAYDPYEPLLPETLDKGGQPLFGWQRDVASGLLLPVALRTDGMLWSPHLDSFLVPDGGYLRLYDRSMRVRLNEAEAEAQARRVAMQLVELQTRRADIEARRAERETRRAEMEARRAEAEAERARTFAEKLRALGIDPEQLL